MNGKNPWIIMEESWILWNNLTKPPVARSVRQLVFWLLMVSSSNYFKLRAWSRSMLLLLHSPFMLSMVKMLLKGAVWGRALNSHGNYIVDHGKSWKNHGIVFLNFCGNPAICYQYIILSRKLCWPFMTPGFRFRFY